MTVGTGKETQAKAAKLLKVQGKNGEHLDAAEEAKRKAELELLILDDAAIRAAAGPVLASTTKTEGGSAI